MRASLYFYNSKADVDAFILKLGGVLAMFKGMSAVAGAGAGTCVGGVLDI